jgi:SWI/SNF-related matrix-associated actin-dependent regulator 1 of chromatin subfamily A
MVPDDHVFWELWRLNRPLLQSRGFKVGRTGAGAWFVEAGNGEAATPELVPVKPSSSLGIPCPPGLAYYPFQREGVEFLASRSAALLGDEMGLGKSIEIIGLLNLLDSELRRVLIVTPASMKTVWALELSKWLVVKRTVSIIKGPTKPEESQAEGIWIINYELLTKFGALLTRDSWDVLVLDEGHYIKSRGAQRTKACFILARKARRKVLLTGTPLLNRPAELWSLLHFLAPSEWPNFYRFAHRYCGAFRSEWGWDFRGASNLEELNARLRGGLMLRRLKADVLTQACRTRQLSQIPEAHIKRYKRPGQRDCISKIRHELGRLKAEPAVQHILEQATDYSEKFVVFAHHHSVLDILHRGLPDSVLVTGETSSEDRAAAIERFRSDSAVRFFIGSIRAMGVGVTLTAASRVIFVEQDWTPAIMRQAEDRLHRISQQNAVVSQYLVVPDSIDVNILRSVISKIDVIKQTIEAEN